MGSCLLLALLVLADGAILGLRASTGRCGEIDKRAHQWRAVRLGLGYATIVVLIGTVIAAAFVFGGAPIGLLGAGARRALAVELPFALLMGPTLIIWIIPQSEWRTLLSVGLLGPGTLVRPYVIAAGLAYAAIPSGAFILWTLAAYGCVSLVGLEYWIRHRHFPIDPAIASHR